MKRAVFPEYLGEISTDLLIQNLKDGTGTMLTFPLSSPLQAFMDAFPKGFKVVANVEFLVPDSHEEQKLAIEQFQNRVAQARTPEEKRESLTPPGRRLVGLTLVPVE
ncbi:MAG TPA: hypothetical protein VK709_01915 [Candidatus Saccharimonadales bacterium]|nr:hypothetical protein [Candidatus Saccharimonadales bacterium]